MRSLIALVTIVTLLVHNALGEGVTPTSKVKPKPGFIVPYKDAHCTNYFESDKTIGGSKARYYDYKFHSIYPSCSNFSDVDFSGAENGNALGYNVFWSVPDPDPGCKILILERVSQDEPSVWECGNVVLAVDQAGCYETPALRSDFMLQYCCGNDCFNATGEYKAKRDLKYYPQMEPLVDITLDRSETQRSRLIFDTVEDNLVLNHKDPALSQLPESSNANVGTYEIALDRHSDTSANVLQARKKHRKKGRFRCDEAQNLGNVFTKAGRQIRMTDTMQCGACADCPIGVTPTVQVSYSITSTTTTTFSDSESMKISVDAGYFIADLKGAFGIEIGHSVADMCGVTNTTSVSRSVSETYSQPAGTHGFVWFTPTLKCQRKILYCESGKPSKGGTFQVDVCEPELKADGSVLGDLGFESTD